jgi:Uma2 family endonuclease
MTVEEMRTVKENRGYSLMQLSDYSGVPLGTVQKIFSGATANPRKATLNALERVLLGTEEQYQGKSIRYEASSMEYMQDRVSESVKKYEYGNKTAYSVTDYFALPKDRRAELIDGRFYDMAAPELVHQDILGYVFTEIYNFIRQKGGSCKVIPSPSSVQLDADDHTMVEPDLYIVCDKSKLRRYGMCGAPDFVLEILSAATRKKDMSLKLYKYYEAGVKEYWIIDPSRKVLIMYDFSDEEFIPQICPLEGEAGVAIYGGELKISLTAIAQLIEDAPS